MQRKRGTVYPDLFSYVPVGILVNVQLLSLSHIQEKYAIIYLKPLNVLGSTRTLKGF